MSTTAHAGGLRRWIKLEHLEDRSVPSATLSLDPTTFASDRVMVTLTRGPLHANAQTDTAGLSASPLTEKVERLGFDIYKVTLRPGVTVNQGMSAFSRLANVQAAELDYKITASAVPNDPGFGNLWGMSAISAPGAWDIGRGTGQTIVAVIDSGVDYNHQDLNANMWRNPGETPGDGIDNDGNGFVDDVYGADFANNDGDPNDDHGHGTHCAGTIGAVGNNAVGVTGVAWTTKIMALKFMDASGSGWASDAARAIDYAIANGAKVLSNSWGTTSNSYAVAAAVSRAQQAGSIFAAAAGNNSSNNDVTPFYPSNLAFDNVISVAATDSSDNLAGFSNYGASTVTLAAPGANIVSTTPGNNYAAWSGTSMATPHVAGAAAVLWDANPTWSYQQVIQRLKSTVDLLPALSGRVASNGRLNLQRALNGSPPTVPPPPVTPPPPPGVTLIDDGDAGFATGAGWAYSPPTNAYPYYGNDHYFRMGAANAPATSWTTGTLPAGSYKVSSTWFAWSNRATNATYQVLDAAGTVLATKTIDQTAAPNDLVADGATWEDMGTVTLPAAGTLTLKLLGAGNNYLIADAARFEAVSPPVVPPPPVSPPPPPPVSPPPPVTVSVIDDGDAGFAAGAGWAYSPPSNYPYFNADHYYKMGAAGSAATTWTTASLPAGTYRVSSTWFAWSNRATNAAYQVLDAAGTVLATRTLDQTQAPNDLTANGASWEDVGTVTLPAAGTLTLKLLGAGNNYLIADAARFEAVSPPPPVTVSVIDDGDAGFAAGAGWAYSPPSNYPYFNADHYYKMGAAGSAATTWTTASLPAGTYRVSSTWFAWSNRATNAAYQVLDAAGAVLATKTIDQTAAPNDLTANGASWEDVGTVTLPAAGTLTLKLLGSGNNYLIADAARFEKVIGANALNLPSANVATDLTTPDEVVFNPIAGTTQNDESDTPEAKSEAQAVWTAEKPTKTEDPKLAVAWQDEAAQTKPQLGLGWIPFEQLDRY